MNRYKDAILDCIKDFKDEQHRLTQDSLYQSSHPLEWMARLQTLSFCIGRLEAKLEEIYVIEYERLHFTPHE